MKRLPFLHRPAAWLLAFAMAFSLLPSLPAQAVSLIYYSLSIGSTQFSSHNLTITDENGGTASFDPDTNTLTLTDFTYEGAGFRGTTINDEGVIYSLLDNLTILLSGNNVLTNVTQEDDAPDFSYAIYSRGPVTVDVLPGAEYGRLVLNGGTSPKYSYGIKVDKSLIVNGGTLYATGGKAPYNTGIYAGYNLVVNDGMVLTNCKEASSLSYGINTYAYDKENEAYNGGLYVNGGSIYAQTTEAPTCIAINSNYNITIRDGLVSATGGTAENGSCGMAASLINLLGGEVVATGGTSPSSSYGIIAGDLFRMEGGKLTATAGETEMGIGIAAQNGIEISSGTVTAQGVGGAMSHAPMADSYDHFSFWYGTDEASAKAAGVKPGSLIPDYCGKPYVHFTDGSDTPVTPEPSNPTFAKAFPDPVFRAYVTDEILYQNTEPKGDTDVITDAQMEILGKRGDISLSDSELTSLQGLEYFTDLEVLNCGHTSITELDISRNTVLKRLACDQTGISDLDTSHNPVLEELICPETPLSALDVSQNPLLNELLCFNTAITTLNLHNNTALTRLDCFGTNIAELDLSRNTALVDLACDYCSLTTLDLRNNPAVVYPYFGNQTSTKTDVPVMQNGDTYTLDMVAFLGENGNVDYVTMTDGGVLNNGIVTYAAKPAAVTYTYDTGMGEMDVTWTPVFEETHTHTYTNVDFAWASDLRYAGVTATCDSCGDTLEQAVYPYWSEVSEGKLVKTAEITLNGTTYSDELVITAERSGNTVTLHLPGIVFAEQIIVAGYSADGQMTECQSTQDYSLTMTFTVTASEVRVFFLKISSLLCNPLTPALIV